MKDVLASLTPGGTGPNRTGFGPEETLVLGSWVFGAKQCGKMAGATLGRPSLT